jgi:hypothetical protein
MLNSAWHGRCEQEDVGVEMIWPISNAVVFSENLTIKD